MLQEEKAFCIEKNDFANMKKKSHYRIITKMGNFSQGILRLFSYDTSVI